MYRLKNIVGYVLIIIAVLLSIRTIQALLNGILESRSEMQKSVSNGVGNAIRSLFVIILFVVIAFFIGKKGLQLVSKTRTYRFNR